MAELTGSPPPPMGNKTGPQSGTNGRGVLGRLGVPVAFFGTDPAVVKRSRRNLLYGQATSGLTGTPPCPDGSYDTYREIMTDPTVQLARAVVFGPILSSELSFESDQDVPTDVVDFIRSQYEGVAPSLREQSLRALDFGARSFEQAYKPVTFRGRTLIGIKNFKPLRPENTEVLIDRDSGDYAGLRNGDVELLPEETLHIPYDMEDDDYYGRSRYENIRERAWWPHVCLERRLGQLAQKISTIIPIVKGPLSSREKIVQSDGSEVEISGYDAGMALLNSLIYGDGVMVENMASAIDDIVGNPDLAKLTKWDVTPYDTGQSASGISGLIEGLRYYDSLKLRGMLRPERTATEGQHGTKAEVAEQADVGLAEGDGLQRRLLQLINKHSVNRLLEWNFGSAMVGKVRLVGSPLIDEKRAIFKWIWTTLLANPAVLDLVVANLDLDAIADVLGIPLISSVNVPQGTVINPAGGTGTGLTTPPVDPSLAAEQQIVAQAA